MTTTEELLKEVLSLIARTLERLARSQERMERRVDAIEGVLFLRDRLRPCELCGFWFEEGSRDGFTGSITHGRKDRVFILCRRCLRRELASPRLLFQHPSTVKKERKMVDAWLMATGSGEPALRLPRLKAIRARVRGSKLRLVPPVKSQERDES